MKTKIFLAAFFILLLTLTALGQSTGEDKIIVPLSYPDKPVFLKTELLSGGIIVKGYSGKEVVVDAQTGDPEDGDNDDDDDEDAKIEKKKGMKRIPNISTGVTVEEDENEVTVSTNVLSSNRITNILIKVPTNTSMKLSTINNGNVSVENVTGDIEVSNLNGNVTLKGITGSAVVDALNGEITVVFAGVDSKKSMSFSSMNGDIDVTIPAETKATMKLKNDMGEIYSDFDIKMNYGTPKLEDNSRERHGRRKVSLEKLMVGAINGGGGAEMLFKNFNGDIYIRKGK